MATQQQLDQYGIKLVTQPNAPGRLFAYAPANNAIGMGGPDQIHEITDPQSFSGLATTPLDSLPKSISGYSGGDVNRPEYQNFFYGKAGGANMTAADFEKNVLGNYISNSALKVSQNANLAKSNANLGANAFTGKPSDFAQPTQQNQTTAPGTATPQTLGDIMNSNQGQTYTVQKGDTLSEIAQRYGVNVSDIKGYRSGNPDLIYPGENLQIGGAKPTQYQSPATDISQKYQQATQSAQNAGITAPTNYTGANTMYNQYLNSQQAPSAMNDFVSQDPYLNATISGFQQYMSQQNQRSSLVDTYKQMLQESGIQQIDTDLINMKNVIEGTEDDIRNEVTKAGGFASDSQVMALSNARNKQLIKNYNTLLETRNSKAQYLDTMMNLTQQDREEANRLFDTQMNFGFKIAEANQQMKKSAVETLDRTAKTIGWDGVYEATQGNPQLQRQIESMYGLPQGSLFIAAQRDSEMRTNARMDRLLEQQQQQFENQMDLDKFEEDKRQFGLNYALQQQKLAQDKSGAAGLSTAQMNSTINQIAGTFDNEQVVKDFNAATAQYQLMDSLGTKGGSPGDDIAFVYAFAKLMDPNSVVREGEYATIQKYAQSFLDAKTLEAIRLAKNTNFLTADAKQKLLNTSYAKMKVMDTQYQNLKSQYQQRIDNVQSGGYNSLQDYSKAFSLQAPGTAQISPQNQQSMDTDYNQMIQTQPAGGGVVDWLKGAWNTFTTPWVPKFK